MRELIKVYERAQKRIRTALTSAALTDFQQFRYAEHAAQVETIIDALNLVRRDLAKGIIAPSYETGINITEWALEQAGRTPGRVEMGSVVHTTAVEAVTEQMVLDLATANESLRTSALRILRLTQQKVLDERQINELISEGIVQGETRVAVSRRLTWKLQEELEEGAKIVINGRNYDPKKYAELVARTRTREAVTEGAIRSAEEFGVFLFQWSVHENACPVCQQYQGKVYAMTEGTGFPLLTVRPPAHPRCEHTLLAYVLGSDETSLLPADAKENEALKRLSRSKQAFIHGQADYQRVLDGGTPSGRAMEWEQSQKDVKRLRRQAARDRAAAEAKELMSAKRAKLSDDPTDVAIRRLIDGTGKVGPETRTAIQKRIGQAYFNPERVKTDPAIVGKASQGRELTASEFSLVAHLGKHSIKDGQWSLDTTHSQYAEDLRRAAGHPDAVIDFYERGTDKGAYIYVETEKIIEKERRGQGSQPFLKVVYSASYGIIKSGYQVGKIPKAKIGTQSWNEAIEKQ